MRIIAVLTVACILFVGCGNGDSSSITDPSLALKNICAAPRTGIDPATDKAYVDKMGSILDEKSWLRAWSDNNYLWNTELPADAVVSNPSLVTVINFFDRLKTQLVLADGVTPKDKFHFSAPTAEVNAYYQKGTKLGYGFNYYTQSNGKVTLIYVETGSAADKAGFKRGDNILSIDGYAPSSSEFLAALHPSKQGEHHDIEFNSNDGINRTATLWANTVVVTPVQNVTVLDNAGINVGYIQLNHFIASAELPLVDAFTMFKQQNVKQLIIDMRYNGGGLSSVASELAYMIAGSQATANALFVRYTANAALTARMTSGELEEPFYSKLYWNNEKPGLALPSLNLTDVTVLTTANTCSASEQLINGLRGVGIHVTIIGNTTCGKPFAFYPADNCGTTYYSINLQGVNNIGFGDYALGLQPDCTADDTDFMHALGDRNEKLLYKALAYQQNQECVGSRLNTDVKQVFRQMDKMPYEQVAVPEMRD